MATSTATQSPARHSADSHDLIRVHGARENNLKDLSVEIPKRRLTVFTGVSGSGKSSLVFDTIAAESQRLINETEGPPSPPPSPSALANARIRRASRGTLGDGTRTQRTPGAHLSGPPAPPPCFVALFTPFDFPDRSAGIGESRSRGGDDG